MGRGNGERIGRVRQKFFYNESERMWECSVVKCIRASKCNILTVYGKRDESGCGARAWMLGNGIQFSMG